MISFKKIFFESLVGLWQVMVILGIKLPDKFGSRFKDLLFDSLHPLFPGSNEVDQIAKIHDVMGTPDPNVLNKLRK